VWLISKNVAAPMMGCRLYRETCDGTELIIPLCRQNCTCENQKGTARL
jgi:hypothetical protein